MTRQHYECPTCGDTVYSFAGVLLHCDPAAFDPTDPDDAAVLEG